MNGCATSLNHIAVGEGFYAFKVGENRSVEIRRPLYRMTVDGPEVAITGQRIDLEPGVYWKVMSPGLGLTWLWQLSDNHVFFRSGCLHDQECDFIGIDTTANGALRLFKMDMAYRSKGIGDRAVALILASIVRAHDVLKYGVKAFKE